MFAGNHSDVTGYGFAASEASRITVEHFGGNGGDRSDIRMSHQSARRWALLRLLLDLAVEIVNRALQLWIQHEQCVALVRRMRSQGQRVEQVASCRPESAHGATRG
jgi:hypothetical protein